VKINIVLKIILIYFNCFFNIYMVYSKPQCELHKPLYHGDVSMKDLQVVHIHCNDVSVVDGRNPRITLVGIEQLAQSIEENGIRNPIKVTQAVGHNKYALVDGHRRLAACQYLLEAKEINIDIPAMVIQHYKDEADILVEMMVSNDGEPFAPFEEGMLYSRLKTEFALTVEQISQRVGKSASHVSDKIALLRADPAVRQAVAQNKITASDANTIIRKSKGDTAKQREVVQRVEDEGREAVIDKDLKKGRMPKAVWALAEGSFDEAWSAMMGVGMEDAKKVLDTTDTRKWLEEEVDSDKHTALDMVFFAYALGQLQVYSNMSSLSFKELWDKLDERISGKKG
jgi:ParB/RepB/Spo0J family partition protein